MAAPQRDLGLRMQQGACAGEVAFVVVRVQQTGRRPAVDVGGQLPGEVDGVEEAGVECDAWGGEQVGGIAGQQDPPVAVSLDLSSVKGETRQRVGSPKGRSTPSTRRTLSRSSVRVIGSSSS